MLRAGILNPHLSSLLGRFRHSNTLVIADRGFPFWPGLETMDLSLVDDIPRVTDVLRAICQTCVIGRAWMADDFEKVNPLQTVESYRQILNGIPLQTEAHEIFKQRVPSAIGLIRTGDTTQYSNIILESA